MRTMYRITGAINKHIIRKPKPGRHSFNSSSQNIHNITLGIQVMFILPTNTRILERDIQQSGQ